MAIDATVGGAAANSFETLDEAAAYFDGRLYTAAWDDAEPADQEKALIWATRLLSSYLCLTGYPTTTTQALPVPRSGLVARNGDALDPSIVPQEWKDAESELALLLLAGAGTDRTAVSDSDAQGLKRVKAGPVELEWRDAEQLDELDDIRRRQAEMRRVIPMQVLMKLVPSWLCAVTYSPSPLLFETF